MVSVGDYFDEKLLQIGGLATNASFWKFQHCPACYAMSKFRVDRKLHYAPLIEFFVIIAQYSCACSFFPGQ